MADFKQIQQQWANWLRQPDSAPPPAAEARRLAVYQRLVRNNIESFLARGFPVLCNVLSERQWQQLVDAFIAKHSATSPLFAQIGAEFVHFLAASPLKDLPAFTYELAVYERMELDAHHCAQACLSEPLASGVDAVAWQINPSLTWGAFSYPVHRIQADVQPAEALADPLFLAVYRVDEPTELRQGSRVKFMQLNAVTMVLIDLLQQQPGQTATQLAQRLAEQLPQFDQTQLYSGLLQTLPDLYQRAMLFPAAN